MVDIEERLLRFSPEAALHAWRLFRVRADGKHLVLSSPMYHDDTTGRTPLWPSAEAEATCYKGHPAPSPGCRCGIYGAVGGTLDSLPGYLRDTAYERDVMMSARPCSPATGTGSRRPPWGSGTGTTDNRRLLESATNREITLVSPGILVKLADSNMVPAGRLSKR